MENMTAACVSPLKSECTFYQGEAIERGTPHQRDDKGGVAFRQRTTHGVVVQSKNVLFGLALQCRGRVLTVRHDALDRAHLRNIWGFVRRCPDCRRPARY